MTAGFLNCDYYKLKREKEITKKTEHNKSYYPVDWINVDYHHVHIKPPSTAIILKVHVVHPVSSMWEMPPCYSIWASLKTCRKTDQEIEIFTKATRLSSKKIKRLTLLPPVIYRTNGSRKSHTSLLGFLILLDKKPSVDLILKDLKSNFVFHVWKTVCLFVWIWCSLLQ